MSKEAFAPSEGLFCFVLSTIKILLQRCFTIQKNISTYAQK